MRYAVLADIHGNLEALKAVLRAIDDAGVDHIVCAGDLVGYYANPNECLAIIEERGIRCIAGNHDRAAVGLKEPTYFSASAKRALWWTRSHLTAESIRFLETLPLVAAIDQRFLLVHGALHPHPNEDLYLTSRPAAVESCKVLVHHPSAVNLCFFGHTHHPIAYRYADGALDEITQDVVAGISVGHWLINPGSVGQSRDEDPRASFLMFDTEQDTVRFHRVDYDLAACLEKAARAGLLREEGLLRRSARWIRKSIGKAARAMLREG